MGMYDYLGNEQIKIFYHPIFMVNKENPEQSTHFYSTGSMASYDKGDHLPLKTLWYQYPENFMVYDYRYDLTDVWIIKEGKFDRLVPYTELTKEEVISPVYDYYGNLTDIKELDDFQMMKDDFNARDEEFDIARKELFPNGFSWKTIKDEEEKVVEQKQEALTQKYNAIKQRYEDKRKWFKDELFLEESTFGAYLECYQFTRLNKDNEPYKDIFMPLEEYEGCRKTLQRLIKETPDIIDRFYKWVDDANFLENHLIPETIQEITSTDSCNIKLESV